MSEFSKNIEGMISEELETNEAERIDGAEPISEESLSGKVDAVDLDMSELDEPESVDLDLSDLDQPETDASSGIGAMIDEELAKGKPLDNPGEKPLFAGDLTQARKEIVAEAEPAVAEETRRLAQEKTEARLAAANRPIEVGMDEPVEAEAEPSPEEEGSPEKSVLDKAFDQVQGRLDRLAERSKEAEDLGEVVATESSRALINDLVELVALEKYGTAGPLKQPREVDGKMVKPDPFQESTTYRTAVRSYLEKGDMKSLKTVIGNALELNFPAFKEIEPPGEILEEQQAAKEMMEANVEQVTGELGLLEARLRSKEKVPREEIDGALRQAVDAFISDDALFGDNSKTIAALAAEIESGQLKGHDKAQDYVAKFVLRNKTRFENLLKNHGAEAMMKNLESTLKEEMPKIRMQSEQRTQYVRGTPGKPPVLGTRLGGMAANDNKPSLIGRIRGWFGGKKAA